MVTIVSTLNNGFYKISQINTKMCLDVSAASLYKGTNVQMWLDNGHYAQQWSIEKTSHGYRIRSRCNAYYLDVVDGKHESNTNVRCWESNNSRAQSFSFIPRNLDEQPVSDGVYVIRTNVNKECILDVSGLPGEFKVGSNVQIWTSKENHNVEKYLIKYVGNGWYKIFEKTSGLIIEFVDPSVDFLNNSKNVQLANDNGSKNQLWKIRKNVDGTYFIINKANGYYLDLENSKTDNGSNVSQCTYNGSNAQRWILELESYTVSYDMNGGSGSIGNQTKTYGQDLTLSGTKPTRTGYEFVGWSTDQNATTAQYQPNEKYTANSSATLYAVWKNISKDFGTYQYANPSKTIVYARISYSGTDKYLTNTNTDENDTSYHNVELRTKDNSRQQIWELEKLSDGSYKFINTFDNQYLDIMNTRTDDGTNIGVWYEYYGNGGQMWFIIKKNGQYVLQPQISSSIYLSAESLSDGGNIQVSTSDSSLNYFNIEIIKPVGMSTLKVESAGSSSTPTKFTWTSASDATWYNLYIYDGEVWKSNCVYGKQNINALEWEVQLKPGTYQAHLSPINQYPWTNSNFVEFTVANSLENTSKISTTQVKLDETVKVTASATGGEGSYTYAVLYKKTSDTKWIVKQNYSTNANLTIRFTSSSEYEICVKVKDKSGTIEKKYFTVNVQSKLENGSTLSANEISLGDTFTANAQATGGTGGYTYAVLYKKVSDTKWTVKQNYKANNAVTIKPAHSTEYDICIKVKDSNGTIEKKYFMVNVKKPALTNNSAVSKSSLTLGNSITINLNP